MTNSYWGVNKLTFSLLKYKYIPSINFYANADFLLNSWYLKEIWIKIGRFQFYWIREYYAQNMVLSYQSTRGYYFK